MTQNEQVDPLLETALRLREEEFPDLSPGLIREVLEMHAQVGSDAGGDRALFRAVRDLIETEVTDETEVTE